MKLKATISLPGQHFSLRQRLSLANIVIASNSPELHDEVYESILKPILRVNDFGPAEYFTQTSDRMVPALKNLERDSTRNLFGVDVTISGVSVTSKRANDDFWDATRRLDEIYCGIISSHLIPELRAQISTRMALDKVVHHPDNEARITSLPEIGPTILDGSVSLDEPSEDDVIMAEAEALFGDKRTLEGMIHLLRKSSLIQAEQTCPGHPESGY